MSSVLYFRIVGSIMYVMVCTPSNISHAASVVSRYIVYLGNEHWQVVKWIMKYLKGTAEMDWTFHNTKFCNSTIDMQIQTMRGTQIIGDH